MLINRVSKIVSCIVKIYVILSLGFIFFTVAVFALHAGLNVCPFHFKHFKKSEAIPVVYGYPTLLTSIRASQGEVVWGGCMVRHTKAICPHCKWSARFSLSSHEDVTELERF